MVDLASSIIAGANSSGNFSIETPQRVLYDARMSWQDFGNQTGESLDWPMVAPFKEGWIAYQSLLKYAGTTDFVRWAKFIRYNDLGQMVWETALNTTHGAAVAGGSDRFMAGNDTHILALNGAKALYLIDMSADNGTYSVDTPFVTLSATNFEQIDSHNGNFLAHKFTGGWVIFGIDLNTTSSTVSVATLDDNFSFLGTDTAGTWSTADAERPWFTSDWNGSGPAIVQPVDHSGLTRVWPVTLSASAAPVIGAATTTTLDQNTITGNYRGTIGNGMHDTMFNADSPLYWVPSNGSESITVANPYYWNLSDYENVTYREGTVSVIAPDVVDFDNTTTSSSPYWGDRHGRWPNVVRHNWVNWSTSAAAYIDMHLALPDDATPQDTCTFGDCYSDLDYDESCFAVVNPTNWKVMFWTITYWRMADHTVGGGFASGDNGLTSYWIAQLGPATTPEPEPETPSWVEFFPIGGVTDPDCPMLGTGKYNVMLYDRGGTRKIAEINDVSFIRWKRDRDDISTAEVRVASPDPACADVLRTIAVGRHEIVIYRNGDRVWEGPITHMEYTPLVVTISAEDVMYYAARTIMHRAYDNRYSKKKSKVAPITRRAQTIMANEMLRKEKLVPSYNILKFMEVRTHKDTSRTSRFTHAYSASVWEELDYLAAKASLDYTTVGRRILINDVHDIIGRTEMLTDKDFSTPLVITTYGRELATRAAVTDGQGHWAAVGGIDPFYGEVELLNSKYGEEVDPENGTTPTTEELKQLQAEMASQAKRDISGRYPVPTVVRVPDGTQLSPNAPVTIDQLVAGVRIPLRATQTVIVLEQEQKLDLLTVEHDENGERVMVTLSPAPGATPWDDSSDTGADEED